MTITDMPTTGPARKVVGATAGAGAGAVTVNLLLWVLDTYVFNPGPVPDPVGMFVIFVIPVALTYLGGYLTPRGVEEIGPPQRRGEHVRR